MRGVWVSDTPCVVCEGPVGARRPSLSALFHFLSISQALMGSWPLCVSAMLLRPW